MGNHCNWPNSVILLHTLRNVYIILIWEGTSQLVPHANSYQFIKSSRTKFFSQLVPVPTRTTFWVNSCQLYHFLSQLVPTLPLFESTRTNSTTFWVNSYQLYHFLSQLVPTLSIVRSTRASYQLVPNCSVNSYQCGTSWLAFIKLPFLFVRCKWKDIWYA